MSKRNAIELPSKLPAMPAKIKHDLLGAKYGRLTVVAYAGYIGRHHKWYCVCDCGVRFKVVSTGALRRNDIKSCGCLHAETMAVVKTTHGCSSKSIYRTWQAMIKRCTKPSDKRWNRYGGRGIKVCDRWLNFEKFLSDMGDRPPGMTLDRIDNDGDYEPSNCRWATRREQANNRGGQRTTHRWEHDGQERTIAEWSEITGISHINLYARVYYQGWSIDRALTTPVDPLAGRFKKGEIRCET